MELDWKTANEWLGKVNAKKEIHDEPRWSWDCNFKLDFDGSLLRVSSRFYPPHKTASKKWEGSVTILFLGEQIMQKEFECNTLDELRVQVEKFTKHYGKAIKAKLT